MAGPKWFNNIVNKLNPSQPAISRAEPIAYPQSNVEWTLAYEKIEIVRRCLEIIINACVSIPFKVTQQTTDSGPQKKISRLINLRPNPFEDRVRLMRRAFLDFLIDGNCFFYYDGNFLYVLPAQDIEIITSPKSLVEKYVYTVMTQEKDTSTGNGGYYTYNPVKRTKHTIEYSPDEIIHVKDDNDRSMFRGKSRLASLIELIRLYTALLDFQRQFFENNAIPGIVLKSENSLSPKVKDRLLQQWAQSYTSMYSGARRPAILDGGLSIDKFSDINFQSLDFEASVERLQEDISKALGVPYVLIKSGNNANITPNMVLFYDLTILPLVAQFASAFEQRFDGLLIRPDATNVSVLQPDLKTQATYVSTLVNAGIIDPNEGRAKLNIEPKDDPEMNKIRIPQNITGSATRPDTGGAPPSKDYLNASEED